MSKVNQRLAFLWGAITLSLGGILVAGSSHTFSFDNYDILFWAAILLIASRIHIRLQNITVSNANVIVLTLLIVFPAWLVMSLIMLTALYTILRNQMSKTGQRSIIVLTMVSFMASGIAFIATLLQTIPAYTPTDDLSLVWMTTTTALAYYLLAVIGLLIIAPLYGHQSAWDTLKQNNYLLPAQHIISALLAVILIQLYREPLLGEWGGWGALCLLLPVFYVRYTAMRRAEQLNSLNLRLHQSETEYRSLTDHLPLGIYRTSADGVILKANPALATMLGYSSVDALKQLNVRDGYPAPDVRERLLKQQAAHGGKLSVEVQLKCKDGKLIWVRDSSYFVTNPDDNLRYIDGVIENISADKAYVETILHTYAMIKRAKQEWESTVDSLSQLVILVDHDYHILRTNRVIEQWGWSDVKSASGQSLIDLMASEFDNIAVTRLFETKKQQVMAGEALRFEIQGQTSERHLMVQINPVSTQTYRHEDQPIQRSFAVVVLSDITLTKQMELAQRQLNTELEARVSERTAQLEQMNTQLRVEIEEREQLTAQLSHWLNQEKELNAFKSRFGSMISHEFRTPLTVIQTSGELIERYGDRLTERHRQQISQRIKQQIKHLLTLLDDITAISQAQTIGLELQPEMMDLYALCEAIISEMGAVLWFTHEIVLHYDGSHCEIHGDVHRLRQMIINLLANAVKYSPEGSRIEIMLECHEDEQIICVRDQGIGIPDEALPHLFETFYRAGNVGAISGTGLGLAIVKLVADMHGGSVTVNSVLGKGTTFTVHLPIS